MFNKVILSLGIICTMSSTAFTQSSDPQQCVEEQQEMRSQYRSLHREYGRQRFDAQGELRSARSAYNRNRITLAGGLANKFYREFMLLSLTAPAATAAAPLQSLLTSPIAMGFYEFLGMGTLGASAVITCDDSNESTEDCAPRAMSLARTLTENGFILSLLRQRRLSEELSHPTSGVEASNQRALNDSETSLNQASGGDLQSLIAGEPMDLSSGQRAIEQLREFEAGLETLIANLWSNYNTQFERYEAHYSDDRRALRNIALVRNKISMLEHTIRTQFIADATRITQQAMRSSRFTCNSANEVSNELAPEDEVSSENAQ